MRWAAVVLALVAGPLQAEEAWRTIETAEDYAATVTGRALVETNGQSRWETADDQTITAVYQGDPYTGRWDWVDDKVCFDGSFQTAGQLKACGRVMTNGAGLVIDWATGGRSMYQVE